MKTLPRLLSVPALLLVSTASAQTVTLGFEEVETTPLTGYPGIIDVGTFSSSGGFGFFAGEFAANGNDGNTVGAYRGEVGVGSGYSNGVITGRQAMFSPNASWIDVTSLDGGLFGIESVWATAAWTTDLNLEFTAFLGGEIVASRSVLLDTYETPELIVFNEGFDGLFFDRLRIDSFGGTINPAFPSELVGDHFILDDLSLRLPVPSPVSLALLSLAGLVRSRRRD